MMVFSFTAKLANNFTFSFVSMAMGYHIYISRTEMISSSLSIDGIVARMFQHRDNPVRFPQ